MDKRKPLVIDSSVAIKWVNSQDELFVEQANKIMKDQNDAKFKIVMPELAKYEISNALLNKKLSHELLLTSLDDFYYLPIEFYIENIKIAQESMEIASKYSMTYYDAVFVSLAKHLGADLVTENFKHQAKYKGKDVKIIPLKDYK